MAQAKILGPFIGHTTTVSSKIWIYTEKYQKLFLGIYQNDTEIKSAEFNFVGQIPASCVEIKDLKPNQKYFYKIFIDENHKEQLRIDSLTDSDLYFYTMPEELANGYRYDFLVMSCHNPVEAGIRGYKNKEWAVWQTLPQIIEETTQNARGDTGYRVLFALLIGDQIYADAIEREVLQETDQNQRIKSYLKIYTQFWDNKDYRKVLCSLPAYLMWDDHDITDGYGSREDAYARENSSALSPEWKNLFAAAKACFTTMQAIRNPEPLTNDGFDVAFKIGKAGFVLADLRSNRNIRGRKIWLDSQFNAVKKWIENNRSGLDILFFVSTVVFAHGAPRIETGVLKRWPPHIQDFFNRVWEIQNKFSGFRKIVTTYLSGLILFLFFILAPAILSIFLLIPFCFCFYIRPRFLISHLFSNLIPPPFVDYYYNSIGDLRDDINDSWSSAPNKVRAEEVLNYFFDIQNDENPDRQLYVCVLTGDIHTAGYSNLYSVNPRHQNRPVINHLVASPVGYPPFSWVGEAFYRKYSGVVSLGTSKSFQAQIAHHFTERNVLICSLRDYSERNLQLKAKFYIEKFPEPQTSVFDLEKSSHKENINWQHY